MLLQRAPSPPTPSPSRWTAGTLTYTTSGLVILFAWLLMGDFAWNARERTMVPIAQISLKGGGANDTLIGLLVGTLPAAMAMFLAPIIAYRSDRYRSRLGRRIPFLLVSTPIATLSMVGIAFSSRIGEALHDLLGPFSPGLPACFIIFFSICWIIFEVAAITGNNLFIALINDVVPSNVLGQFFGLFRVVSLGVGVGFSYFLMGKIESHLMMMSVALAIIYGIGFGVMCLRVKEGSYPEPPPSSERIGFLAAARQYFKQCFHHPFYRWSFGITALTLAAFTPVNTFGVFYAKSIGLGLDQYGKSLAIGLIIALALSCPIGYVADRIHPLRVGLGALLLYIPLCLWGAFFATTPETFKIAFIAHIAVTGIYFTGTASIGQRLYPKESFAQFASAAQIILGITTMLIPPLMGMMLDLSAQHYPLTFLVGGILSIFATGGFFILLRSFKRLGGDNSYTPPLQ